MFYKVDYSTQTFYAKVLFEAKGETTHVGTIGLVPGKLCFDSRSLTLETTGFNLVVRMVESRVEDTYCLFLADDTMLSKTVESLSAIGQALARLDPESGISLEIEVSKAIRIQARKTSAQVSAGLFSAAKKVPVDEYKIRFTGTHVHGSLEKFAYVGSEIATCVELLTDTGPPTAVFEAIRASWAKICEEGKERVARYFAA